MGKASRLKRDQLPMAVKKDRKWFPMAVTALVVVIVAAIVVVVVANSNKINGPVQAPASTSVDQTTGAITIGNGATVIDEYLDFGCPHCGEWEQRSSAEVGDVVKRGLATLNIHPVSILDSSFRGTKYSTRAASAAYCVADAKPAAAYAYVQLLFKAQPTEGTSGLSNKKLASLAKQAGAPGAASCIAAGKYENFVTTMTQKTPVQQGAGGISTPTVLVDGQFINTADDPAISIVAEAESK